MRMKKFYLFLLAAFFSLLPSAAQQMPDFSTEESPVWYYVQFNTGGNYLSDRGSGQTANTSATAASDAQKWQLVGNAESFKLKSKSGRFLDWNGSRFTTTSRGVSLKLVENEAFECWEIQRSGSSNNLNQFGGTAAGVELGEWTPGDANNRLSFVVASLVFSDSENEQWYYILSARSGYALQNNGAGECVTTELNKRNKDAQLWKFVGNDTKFQIVNKLGQFAEISNVPFSGESSGGACPTPLRTSDKEYAKGFKAFPTKNTTYKGWEIAAADNNSQGLNTWGQPGVGEILGIWNFADNNNVFQLIRQQDLPMTEFNDIAGIASYSPENKLTLWYDQPATTTGVSNTWMEYSLPIGNGQLGASLFGGLYKDEIQFNEKTLWSGRSTDFSSSNYGYYLNFGSVMAEELADADGNFSGEGSTDYYRQLDLTTATGKVSYKDKNGVTYTREYIASKPNEVIAARYKADAEGKINLRFTLKPGKPGLSAKTTYSDGTAGFSGKLDIVSYNAKLKVVNTGGSITTSDEGISVQGANEVLVLLTGATDYDATADGYISNTAALPQTVDARINDAEAAGWDELYARHTTDFKALFDRASFSLGGTQNTMPTDRLVNDYATTRNQMLEQLYFAYGRYLEISSSRGVDLPSNLQGIWNNSSTPPWHSDIHSNINVQMNYWPAEPTNLSETHLPFLNYIINMATVHPQWQGYAKTYAKQQRGWTCFTENNIFGGSGSFGTNYVIANAWYCTHLWQHYKYTLDKEFLKRAFPTMLSATQFWIDRLVKASDGTYEAPNEYSPEQNNSYVLSQNATAHAQQLVHELFSNTLQAIDILGSDAEISDADLAKLEDRFKNLDSGLRTETYNGNWGTSLLPVGAKLLKEWKYAAYTYGENGHRHLSHLMCLYPLSQLTQGSDLFKAAVNSLKLRGDASTGWSMGWKINLWARALDGDHAREILKLALRHSTSYGTDQYRGGIYYNLFDSHAPFQIDGNFGATSGIAEMLMQSHSDTVQILPALPSAWKDGDFKGLKAIGDFTVSATWKDGKATTAEIVSNQGQPLYINYPGIAGKKISVDGTEVKATAINANTVKVEAQKGQTVTVDFSQIATGISAAQVGGSDLEIAVSGRTVTAHGANVAGLEISDLGGRTVQRTSASYIEVDPANGAVVIATATANNGTKTSKKVVLK